MLTNLLAKLAAEGRRWFRINQCPPARRDRLDVGTRRLLWECYFDEDRSATKRKKISHTGNLDSWSNSSPLNEPNPYVASLLFHNSYRPCLISDLRTQALGVDPPIS